jgi:nucleoside phosphorylase
MACAHASSRPRRSGSSPISPISTPPVRSSTNWTSVDRATRHAGAIPPQTSIGWLAPPYPTPVIKTVLVSGDRDLIAAEFGELAAKYHHAVASDWESGAIAYTCARNRQRLVILRGITDLVDPAAGGEAYGNLALFERNAATVMNALLDAPPAWLARMP